jgi:hypothetical protein
MTVDDFLDTLISFIDNEVSSINFSEQIDQSYSNSVKRTQTYLIDNLKNVEVNSKSLSTPAVEYEKLAEIIAKIEDIYEERYIGFNKNKIVNLKVSKNLNNVLMRRFGYIDYIKSINKCKKGYITDASNLVRDFDSKKTFNLYVHATARKDTEGGQDKQIFYLPKTNTKNIYIINRIVAKNHKGSLFTSNNYDNLNLLPFLSMLSKICFNNANTSENENLIYFMNTSLIIVGDESFLNYNERVKNIFNDKISLRDWFFNKDYQKNEEVHLVKHLMLFLIETVLDIIKVIDTNQFKKKLQKDEKTIVEQVDLLIKSILYLSEKHDIAISNNDKELLHYFIDKVEEHHTNYGNINLKKIKYKEENYDIKEVLTLCNQYKSSWMSRQDISSLTYQNFCDQIFKIFNINEKEKKAYFTNINKANIPVNFRKLFGIEKADIRYFTLLEQCILFRRFPGHINFLMVTQNKEINKHLLLLLSLIKVINIKEYRTKLENFISTEYGSLSSSLNYGFDNYSDDQIKILIVSEMLFPESLHFENVLYCNIKELIYSYLTPIFLKSIDNEKLDEIFTNVVVPSKEELYDEIIKVHLDSENIISPQKFAELIISNLGLAIGFDFCLYAKEKDEFLSKSLFWYFSHRFFGCTEDYIKNNCILINENACS